MLCVFAKLKGSRVSIPVCCGPTVSDGHLSVSGVPHDSLHTLKHLHKWGERERKQEKTRENERERERARENKRERERARENEREREKEREVCPCQ